MNYYLTINNMKNIIYVLIFCLPFLINGQISNEDLNKEKSKTHLLEWLKDLNEQGIEMTEDSLIVSREFQKVLNDADYRSSIYPSTYTWQQTTEILKIQNLKLAFWYFINLYGQDEKSKVVVINSIIAYDQLFKMDELLVNAFYTYSFMDPQIAVIKDGKPEIVRPDIMEEKLANVREMVTYILKYREQKELESKKE